ncbi:DNA-binding response regulator, OmpR family, contains REC and winged-helix (wHTH) domain [Paenibacillus barengoltzii]|uniref:response regulator transcription factor n=1 Tax=Paenibacillus barengoltzii TaxID=343517 RepID=UPI000A085F96|nr:response regulator transcription factor [Paenibacillus barengoltzii]SMF61033.1 DNA-binding response regulator, OmpR family, contains REC and winged-helix (wHTH) domain [Paenibacillus barengoltzii]
MAHILAVDDDPAVLTLIRNILQKEGHLVTALSAPSEVLTLQLGSFDLIVLDVMMPELDGFTLCRQIRSKVDCPILFLTAKSMENDLVEGLSIGADDYIVKPFGAGELRARIAAHLRRESRERRSVLLIGEVHFNLSGKEMRVRDTLIPLTKSEYAICEFLALHRGQVFSKDQIYESVFGFDGESEVSTIVEHVKNIRAKLNQMNVNPIETVWGIGYRWK